MKTINGGKEINTRDNNLIAWLMSGLFGVLSGLFLVLGYQLEKNDCINLSDQNAIYVLLVLIVVLTVDTRNVWKGYEASKKGKKFLGLIDLTGFHNRSNTADSSLAVFGSRTFFETWICLIILMLPVLLAEFPGFFVYDAQDELNEVLTRTFTTHHPLLHVLLLGGIIAAVHKLTLSWNLGIFVYILFQMVIITGIFAYVISYLLQKGTGRKSRVLFTLFYGVFPTVVMFVLCSSKDGLFSAMLLLLTLLLYRLVNETDEFVKDKRNIAAFIVAAVLMPCFRHNGFYAYLVFVPFALIWFRKRLKSVISVMIVVPVILYILISSVLSFAFTDGTSHHQEMLTVPIMQMARVYAYQKDELSEEDIATLTAYIPEENLKLYTPRVSDLIKVDFNNSLYEKDSAGFWRLWFKLLKEHPMTYVNSALLTSYGYWYPAAKINVYNGTTVYTFTYEHSSYFGYEVEAPGERHSLIKPIDDLYRYLSIGTFHDDQKILAIFFAPGLFAVMYLFVFCYRVAYGKINEVLPFIPMALTWCTVLLGPTYLVRYVVYLWFCFPLLFLPGRHRKESN